MLWIGEFFNSKNISEFNPFDTYAGYEHLTLAQLDELRTWECANNVPRTESNKRLLELIYKAYD